MYNPKLTVNEEDNVTGLIFLLILFIIHYPSFHTKSNFYLSRISRK